MARSSQGLALVAAAAVIGGLAWWFLGPSRTPTPTDGGTARTAPVTEGSGGRRESAAPKLVEARAAGTLLAVVKGEGKPLAATLTAVPAADVHEDPATAAGSATDGAIRLAGAPAGVKLRVTIAAPGWRTAVLQDVEVPAGGEKDLGAVDLERALPATGRVLDPSGKPVAGATVGALDDTATGRFDFRKLADLIMNEPDWKAKATTREDGTFTLDALGPGTWNLVASAPGFSPSAEKNVLLHPAGTAPPVDLVLQQGHSLLVKVTGAGDAPVSGAEASAASSSRNGVPVSMGPARGVTNAAGEAQLSGVTPGRTIVAVRASEGRLVVRTIEVPTTPTVTVRMGGTAALLVRVKTAEGAPVEGASVMAVSQSGSGGNDSGEAMSGKTGADGTVKWEHLQASRMAFVMVEKDGFPPVTPDGGGMGGGREELKEGQTLEKDIVLKAGATITGTVRRKPGDGAVPGAAVTVAGNMAFFGGRPTRATADAEGNYRLEGVPEGRVQLTASAPGLAPPNAWASNGMPAMMGPPQEGENLPEGAVMVPPGGGELKKDLVLEETGSVTGRVLGPTGEGIGSARVEISSNQGFNFRGFAFGGGGSDGLPGPVLTATDGSFTVKGVPAGQGLVARADAPNLIGAASSPFNLAAGESATAGEIRLTEGGSLAGRVSSGTGSPVAGAKVRAFSRQPRTGPRMMGGPGGIQGLLEATSGADGTWRIANVAPGPASVTVTAEGFIDATKGDLTVASGVESRADVALEPGRVIAGTVRDAAGAPVEGARVFARSAEGTAPESMKFAQGTTDAAGAFRLTGLPVANFILTVSAQGSATRIVNDIAAGNEAVEVRLAAAVRMSGKVVDTEGNPVAGAMVRATSEASDGVTGGGRSGADGTFNVDGLAAGTYSVTAQTFDRKYGRTELKGIAGDATGVVLTLSKALEIRGRVVGADGGVPAERGLVWATEAAPGSLAMGGQGRARWEEDGSFVLTGLSEGSYVVHAAIAGKFEGSATVLAGSTGVSVRLEASATAGTGPGIPPAPGGVPAPRPPR